MLIPFLSETRHVCRIRLSVTVLQEVRSERHNNPLSTLHWRDADYDVAAAISYPYSMSIVSPQLFFSCTLRPLTAKVDRYNHSPDDIPLDMVFFSAFEDLHLRFSGTMESNGIRKPY